MELFLAALGQLFAWGTFEWLLLGVFAGLLVGLIPGLGGITFISIALPFLFVMPTDAAFGLLVGFMAVGTTSDTIPAVLLAIPGSSAGQATVLDGHAMAKQGQAARALGASFTASVLGGIVGALVLLVSVPFVRPLVLSFGYPEFFMLGLWGLSMVARLSSGAVTKGLIMAGFGLLVGAVGSEARSGYPRWEFGQTFLLDGVDLAVLAMAAFAIPELISLAVRRTAISDVPPITNLVHGQLQGARDALRNWGTVVRGGVIGALVSVIPGMGGSVPGWLAYGVTVQTSRDKSRFGRGDVRGVIGPDSAANASDGGQLIPALAFGVPGSGGMAFLLAVFSAQGIQTGSSLLTTRVDVVYFFVIGLVVANVIGAVICFFAANQLARLSYAPYYLLFAIFIPVLFLSAYQSTSQVANVSMLVLVGCISYGLRQFGWPRPPFLLGFVLSPVLEANLSSSIAVHGQTAWMTRPIVLVLFGFILIGLFGSGLWRAARLLREPSTSSWMRVRKLVKVSRRTARLQQRSQHAGGSPLSVPDFPTEVQDSDAGFDGSPELVHRRNWYTSLDILVTLLLIAFLLFALWLALEWPGDARRFPLAVGGTTLLLLAVQLMHRVRSRAGDSMGGNAAFEMPADISELGFEVIRRSAFQFGWLIALVVGVYVIGIALVMPIFTVAYIRLVGGVRWTYSILSGLGFAAFEWILFDRIAQLYWYPGLFFG